MQSTIVFTVLILAGSATLLLSFAAGDKKRRYVRGRHERYVAKSLEIMYTIWTMIFHASGLTVGIFMYETSTMTAVNIAILALIVALYMKIIIRLLSDGDDDWFNDNYKKCKKRIKRLRAKMRTRSVSRPAIA